MLSVLFGVAFIVAGLLVAVWGHVGYDRQPYRDNWPLLVRLAFEPWRAWRRRYDRLAAAVTGLFLVMLGAFILAASAI
jgi:hypothetical protein